MAGIAKVLRSEGPDASGGRAVFPAKCLPIVARADLYGVDK